MTIDLSLVNEFQRCFGVEAAFEKARDLMFAYVSLVRRPLPPLGAEGWKVARKVHEGAATCEERENARMAIWDYIGDRKAWNDTSPEYCIIRVVIMFLSTGPGTDNIAELLREYLWMVDKFEDHLDVAQQMIQQFFSSAQG